MTIYVESNGIHTGIVVPKRAAGIDWRRVAPPSDLADPRFGAYPYLALGWGERTFFLETPTWADVRPRTILAAAIGSDRTLLHVEHIPRPVPDADVRAVVLTPDQYRRLAHAIAGHRLPGGDRARGYAGNDVFYAAKGHYDALRTCNSWTGTMLRTAGVRVGAWTPFPSTVMRWF